ncbi:MAG TPA: type II toxin-antitoxin system RelE/ParE family toxin [Chitinophagales bacterium]|nr:type II toxin-antitoxin system RelE/ParE family toxin [Chitinophagales bacterium]
MNYLLEFTAAAKADLLESYDWYQQKLSGLGDDFLDAVEEQIYFILNNATSVAIFVDDYRKVNTKRFPFKIIFSVNKSTIIIEAVYHHNRDIKKWKR